MISLLLFCLIPYWISAQFTMNGGQFEGQTQLHEITFGNKYASSLPCNTTVNTFATYENEYLAYGGSTKDKATVEGAMSIGSVSCFDFSVPFIDMYYQTTKNWTKFFDYGPHDKGVFKLRRFAEIKHIVTAEPSSLSPLGTPQKEPGYIFALLEAEQETVAYNNFEFEIFHQILVLRMQNGTMEGAYSIPHSQSNNILPLRTRDFLVQRFPMDYLIPIYKHFTAVWTPYKSAGDSFEMAIYVANLGGTLTKFALPNVEKTFGIRALALYNKHVYASGTAKLVGASEFRCYFFKIDLEEEAVKETHYLEYGNFAEANTLTVTVDAIASHQNQALTRIFGIGTTRSAESYNSMPNFHSSSTKASLFLFYFRTRDSEYGSCSTAVTVLRIKNPFMGYLADASREVLAFSYNLGTDTLSAMMFQSQHGFQWDRSPQIATVMNDPLYRVDFSGVATASCLNDGPELNITTYTHGSSCFDTSCDYTQIAFDYGQVNTEILATFTGTRYNTQSISAFDQSVYINSGGQGGGITSLMVNSQFSESAAYYLEEEWGVLYNSTEFMVQKSSEVLMAATKLCTQSSLQISQKTLQLFRPGDGYQTFDPLDYLPQEASEGCTPFTGRHARFHSPWCKDENCTHFATSSAYSSDAQYNFTINTNELTDVYSSQGPLSHVLEVPFVLQDMVNASISEQVMLQVPFVLTKKAERDFYVQEKDEGDCSSFDVPFSKIVAIFNTPWAQSSSSEWDTHYCSPTAMEFKTAPGIYASKVQAYESGELTLASSTLQLPYCKSYVLAQQFIRAQCENGFTRETNFTVRALPSSDPDFPYNCEEILQPFQGQEAAYLMFDPNQGVISANSFLESHFDSSTSALKKGFFTTCTNGTEVVFSLRATGTLEPVNTSALIEAVDPSPSFAVNVSTDGKAGSAEEYFLVADFESIWNSLMYPQQKIRLHIFVCQASPPVITPAKNEPAVLKFRIEYPGEQVKVPKDEWLLLFTVNGNTDCLLAFISASVLRDDEQSYWSKGIGTTQSPVDQQLVVVPSKFSNGHHSFFMGLHYSESGVASYREIKLEITECDQSHGDQFKIQFRTPLKLFGFVEADEITLGVPSGTKENELHLFENYLEVSATREECSMTAHSLSLPEKFGASGEIYKGSLQISTGRDGQLIKTEFPVTAVVCSEGEDIEIDNKLWPTDNSLVLDTKQESPSAPGYYQYDLGQAFSVVFDDTHKENPIYTGSCSNLTFQLCETKDCSKPFTSKLVQVVDFATEIEVPPVEPPPVRRDLAVLTQSPFRRIDFYLKITTMGKKSQVLPMKAVVCGSQILTLKLQEINLHLNEDHLDAHPKYALSSLFELDEELCKVTSVELESDDDSPLSEKAQKQVADLDFQKDSLLINVSEIAINWPQTLEVALKFESRAGVSVSLPVKLDFRLVINHLARKDAQSGDVSTQINTPPYFKGSLEVWDANQTENSDELWFGTPFAEDSQGDEIIASYDIPLALRDYVDVDSLKYLQYVYFTGNITMTRVPSFLNDTAHVITFTLADETHRAFYDQFIRIRLLPRDEVSIDPVGPTEPNPNQPPTPEEEGEEEQKEDKPMIWVPPQENSEETRGKKEKPVPPKIKIAQVSPLGEISIEFNQPFLVPQDQRKLDYSRYLQVLLLSPEDDSIMPSHFLMEPSEENKPASSAPPSTPDAEPLNSQGEKAIPDMLPPIPEGGLLPLPPTLQGSRQPVKPQSSQEVLISVPEKPEDITDPFDPDRFEGKKEDDSNHGRFDQRKHRKLQSGSNCEHCTSQAKQSTWQLVEHSEMGMRIQLNFDNPHLVSTSNEGQDIVLVQILEEGLFVARDSREVLARDDLVSTKCLGIEGVVCTLMPPLMQSRVKAQAIKVTAETIESGVSLIASGNLAVSILIGGSVQTLFGMIRLIQVLMLGAVIEVVYPAHLNLFYQTSVQIAEMDLFQGPKIYERIFAFKETEPLTLTFEQFEIGDMNFFMNSGSLLIAAAFAIVSGLTWKALRQVAKATYKLRCCRRVGLSSEKFSQIFAPVMKMFMECYIDIVLSTFLSLIAILKTDSISSLNEWFGTFDDFMSTSITTICLVGIFLVPLRIRQAITKHFRRLDDPVIKLRYGIYYEDFKTDTLTQASFFSLMMLRRLIMIFILVEFCRAPAFQTKLFIILSLITVSVHLHVRPYRDRARGKIETMNEISVLFSAHMHHSFLFSIGNNEATQSYKSIAGWIVIGNVVFHILLNVSRVILNTSQTLYRAIAKLHKNLSKTLRLRVEHAADQRLTQKLGKKLGLSHTEKALFGGLNEQEAMDFCQEYARERKWCLKYNLSLSGLPEEQKFREYILEFNFQQQREQLLMERELKQKLKEKYQRIRKSKMVKRRSERLEHLAQGVTLSVLSNSQAEIASFQDNSASFLDDGITPTPLQAVTKKKSWIKKQSQKAFASVKNWIRKDSDHLPTITEHGDEYNRRASSYVPGGTMRKESKTKLPASQQDSGQPSPHFELYFGSKPVTSQQNTNRPSPLASGNRNSMRQNRLTSMNEENKEDESGSERPQTLVGSGRMIQDSQITRSEVTALNPQYFEDSEQQRREQAENPYGIKLGPESRNESSILEMSLMNQSQVNRPDMSTEALVLDTTQSPRLQTLGGGNDANTCQTLVTEQPLMKSRKQYLSELKVQESKRKVDEEMDLSLQIEEVKAQFLQNHLHRLQKNKLREEIIAKAISSEQQPGRSQPKKESSSSFLDVLDIFRAKSNQAESLDLQSKLDEVKSKQQIVTAKMNNRLSKKLALFTSFQSDSSPVVRYTSQVLNVDSDQEKVSGGLTEQLEQFDFVENIDGLIEKEDDCFVCIDDDEEDSLPKEKSELSYGTVGFIDRFDSPKMPSPSASPKAFKQVKSKLIIGNADPFSDRSSLPVEENLPSSSPPTPQAQPPLIMGNKFIRNPALVMPAVLQRLGLPTPKLFKPEGDTVFETVLNGISASPLLASAFAMVVKLSSECQRCKSLEWTDDASLPYLPIKFGQLWEVSSLIDQFMGYPKGRLTLKPCEKCDGVTRHLIKYRFQGEHQPEHVIVKLCPGPTLKEESDCLQCCSMDELQAILKLQEASTSSLKLSELDVDVLLKESEPNDFQLPSRCFSISQQLDLTETARCTIDFGKLGEEEDESSSSESSSEEEEPQPSLKPLSQMTTPELIAYFEELRESSKRRLSEMRAKKLLQHLGGPDEEEEEPQSSSSSNPTQSVPTPPRKSEWYHLSVAFTGQDDEPLQISSEEESEEQVQEQPQPPEPEKKKRPPFYAGGGANAGKRKLSMSSVEVVRGPKKFIQFRKTAHGGFSGQLSGDFQSSTRYFRNSATNLSHRMSLGGSSQNSFVNQTSISSFEGEDLIRGGGRSNSEYSMKFANDEEEGFEDEPASLRQAEPVEGPRPASPAAYSKAQPQIQQKQVKFLQEDQIQFQKRQASSNQMGKQAAIQEAASRFKSKTSSSPKKKFVSVKGPKSAKSAAKAITKISQQMQVYGPDVGGQKQLPSKPSKSSRNPKAKTLHSSKPHFEVVHEEEGEDEEAKEGGEAEQIGQEEPTPEPNVEAGEKPEDIDERPQSFRSQPQESMPRNPQELPQSLQSSIAFHDQELQQDQQQAIQPSQFLLPPVVPNHPHQAQSFSRQPLFLILSRATQ